MRKFVPAIFGFALFLSAGTLFAQINMSAGITAGGSFFNVGASSVADYSYKTGINVGGVFNLDVSKYMSLDANPEFTMRGYDSRGTKYSVVDTTAASVTNNLAYIALPIHVRLKYPVSSACNAFVLTGPDLGLLVSSKLDSSGSGFSSSTSVKNSFNTLDFGWDFGFGAEYSISQFTPFIEVAYYLDISDINKSPNFYTGSGNDLDIVHHSFGCEAKVGIRMAIK
jgi:opacity protein-like surface antigen